MNEEGDAPVASPTAGRLLRQARERQGLHIAALAAAIKVVPRKLELLEADRLDELPDATFARALAQTVCRALKIDSAPILRLLPAPAGHPLANVGEGLNAPFRDRPGALVQRDGTSFAMAPIFWVVLLILVAAAAVYFVPQSVHSTASKKARVIAASEPASASELPVPQMAEAASAPGVDASGVAVASPLASSPLSAPSASTPFDAAPARVETAAAVAGAQSTSADASPASAAMPAGAIQLQTSAPSWIVVTDARGRALVSRLVQPGEALGLDGAPPFRVRIGNAAGTRMAFRGQPMELAAYTRDNVARLELK